MYLRRLKKIGEVTVWFVDGAYVRNHLSPSFILADQHWYLRCIPRNEIWVEDVFPRVEQQLILHHELYERRLMAQGLRYPDAHRRATLSEAYYRHHR